MREPKSLRDGFSTVELVIAIIVLIALGIAGYGVVKAYKKPAITSSQTVANNTPTPNNSPYNVGTKFEGKITDNGCADAMNNHIPIGDVGCSITVGNIVVQVMHGNMAQTRAWGTWTLPGSPNAPDVGMNVQVYAHKVTSTNYTLEGSADYYLKPASQ